MQVLSEKQIDAAVIGQAGDDAAWERLVRVRRRRTSLSLSAELAARAAFFARLHRETSVDEWLRRIIRERIDLEEAALSRVSRELGRKRSA
jgi:hypothetical protein